ncbi:DUF6443 domain-containing protein, partial [Xanthomarina gelatinilytica]|uniref:DUF6443 domain-containing protein n=1 Tax=Xanthomarina gelatinilytica TaxID=1137281 RepID=UPI003AA9CCC0
MTHLNPLDYKSFIIIIVFAFSTLVSAQDSTSINRVSVTTNHIYSIFIQEENELDQLIPVGQEYDQFLINDILDNYKAIERLDYYTGQGNLYQSIQFKAGGGQEDIVSQIVYDGLGRSIMSHLPYSTNLNPYNYNSIFGFSYYREISYNGANGVLENLDNYYSVKFPDEWDTMNIINHFSETLFEESPLNRIIEEAAPGSDWAIGNGHTIKFEYKTNTFDASNPTNPLKDNVKLFSVTHPNNDTETGTLVFDGHYAKNQLYKTVTKDENWQPNQTHPKDHTTEEYKNKQGQIILKRTFNDNEAHDNYYVYDDFGNLTYVLPPEASYQIVDEGAVGFRIASQTNYPWTDLVLVDNEFAQEYNKKLSEYENSEILNTDLINEYGAQGGFTVNTHQDQDLVSLSITFSAATPFALRQGELVSLDAYGKYADTELGKLTGIDYEYIFLIKNNRIVIEKAGIGEGKLTSVNQMFNSDIKLSYTQNYPWTTYTDVDAKFAVEYEKQLEAYPNSDILGVTIPNEYGGQGGLHITIDEHDNVLLTFNSTTAIPLKLKQGLVLPLNAKRRIDDRDNFETFQGYTLSIKDNNLHISGKQAITSFVFTCGTPVPAVTPETVEGLCYIYHYDYRNRLIEKKIPGKDWEYIVYDKLDRPILTQDANLRLENKWLFTKYDVFSRVLYTGIYAIDSASTTTRMQLQDQINGQADPQWYETRTDAPIVINTIVSDTETSNPPVYYTNNSFPNTNLELHTINYHDDYVINLDPAFDYQDSYGQILATNTKSLPTVNEVRILGTNDWITTAMYYDEKGRQIFAVSKNEYLSTTDWTKMQLDFVGKTIETTTKHQKTGHPDIKIVDTYTYDHAQRLLSQTQTINDGIPELIVNNHYDELGQLVSKNVGGTVATIPEDSNGLQTVDYKYNIRGWLKSINDGDTAGDDLFGFKLNYSSPEHTGITPLYNGNISETHWQTANDHNPRSYGYGYDALNRIKTAGYFGNYALEDHPMEIENFSLEMVNYDKNGNITYLKRHGLDVSSNEMDYIDDLTYNYAPKSNTLISVIDIASEDGFNDGNTIDDDYFYDGNGNMVEDKNKNIIAIEYNHLNLPTHIQFDNSSPVPDGTINYVYDATGVKMEKNVSMVGSGSTITQYAGNYVYENRINIIPGGTTTSSELKFFSHPEGYAEPDGLGNFDYIYQYKDHLGNIRLSYKLEGLEEEIDNFNDGTTGSWGSHNSTITNDNEQLKVVLS